MKKIISLALFILLLSLQAISQTVSDKELVRMVQDARKQGMTQEQIGTLLMQKGVSVEQIRRLKEQYEKGTFDVNRLSDGKTESRDRMRKLPLTEEQRQENRGYLRENETTGDPLFQGRGGETPFLDSVAYTMGMPRPQKAKENTKIYGKDVFNNVLLTFEPQLNIATPENYLLGPGDEVIIDIWGASEEMIRQVIAPEGHIIVEKVGPIRLGGLSIKEANVRLKNELSAKGYAGIKTGSVFANLTLGEIRSIQVNVMGEVAMPGTYTLPSLASAFHALYSAGGINDIGSLRSVKVFRNGTLLSDFDVYEYIFQGKNTLNIILQDGDVVMVSPYINLVAIHGKVKRPMIYEMKDTETVDDLLAYAGGFAGDAYRDNIRLIRKSGREYQVYNVDRADYKTYRLADGDSLSVDKVLPRFENRVELRGAVYREGLYAVGDKVKTVSQLIAKADGVKGDAFLNRAVLYREKSDLTLEAIALDLAGILNGTAEDIVLQNNDALYLPSIMDLQEEFVIGVKGAVRYPGTYKYVDKMTLEDVIVQAGGLLESASQVNVEVARRIKAPKSTTIGDQRVQMYSLIIRDGLLVGGPADFTLQPFDEIYIRFSPVYRVQQDVRIEGEVLFAGEYAMSTKGEQLSDLVKRAGGMTPDAFSEGARLLRKRTDEEKRLMRESLERLKRQQSYTNDTLNLDFSEITDYYSIGIELDKAIENPHSEHDLLLKEGDRLIVPEYNGVVKISGAVMYPNTVTYQPEINSLRYIKQAGGYSQRARKCKVYVVYMNGTVAVGRGRNLDIRPGCEIIVPMKRPRRGMSIAEVMTMATSATSMMALITSMVNMTK